MLFIFFKPKNIASAQLTELHPYLEIAAAALVRPVVAVELAVALVGQGDAGAVVASEGLVGAGGQGDGHQVAREVLAHVGAHVGTYFAEVGT